MIMVSQLKDYGRRIREERLRLKLIQYDVARACHKSRSIPGKWENGETMPNLQAIECMHHIGFDIVYIITGEKHSIGAYYDGEKWHENLTIQQI